MKIYGMSHKGKVRENNEDSYYYEKLSDSLSICILADGMGGHQGGLEAGSTAVEFICSELINIKENLNIDNALEIMVNISKKANDLVYNISLQNPNLANMGTTLIVCIIIDKKVFVLHVGDSRLYLVNNKKLARITNDHTIVNELLKNNLITEFEAETHPHKNQITRSIGCDNEFAYDNFSFCLEDESKILICSDGLSDMVKDDEIEKILNKKIKTDRKVNNLIRMANENGGKDNITVILVEEV